MAQEQGTLLRIAAYKLVKALDGACVVLVATRVLNGPRPLLHDFLRRFPFVQFYLDVIPVDAFYRSLVQYGLAYVGFVALVIIKVNHVASAEVPLLAVTTAPFLLQFRFL